MPPAPTPLARASDSRPRRGYAPGAVCVLLDASGIASTAAAIQWRRPGAPKIKRWCERALHMPARHVGARPRTRREAELLRCAQNQTLRRWRARVLHGHRARRSALFIFKRRLSDAASSRQCLAAAPRLRARRGVRSPRCERNRGHRAAIPWRPGAPKIKRVPPRRPARVATSSSCPAGCSSTCRWCRAW